MKTIFKELIKWMFSVADVSEIIMNGDGFLNISIEKDGKTYKVSVFEEKARDDVQV